MCKRQLSAQEALLGFNEAPEVGAPKVQETPGFTLGLQFGHFSVQRGGGDADVSRRDDEKVGRRFIAGTGVLEFDLVPEGRSKLGLVRGSGASRKNMSVF
jgi:hypothetical protein